MEENKSPERKKRIEIESKKQKEVKSPELSPSRAKPQQQQDKTIKAVQNSPKLREIDHVKRDELISKDGMDEFNLDEEIKSNGAIIQNEEEKSNNENQRLSLESPNSPSKNALKAFLNILLSPLTSDAKKQELLMKYV